LRDAIALDPGDASIYRELARTTPGAPRGHRARGRRGRGGGRTPAPETEAAPAPR
jgi:hypothetical protein